MHRVLVTLATVVEVVLPRVGGSPGDFWGRHTVGVHGERLVEPFADLFDHGAGQHAVQVPTGTFFSRMIVWTCCMIAFCSGVNWSARTNVRAASAVDLGSVCGMR